MGKSLPCTASLHQFTTPMLSSHRIGSLDEPELTSGSRISITQKRRSSGFRIDSGPVKQNKMEPCDGKERVPLSEVVAELVSSWFQDALEAAMSGDNAMQVLVGQMYCRGYGVARDVQKGRSWIKRASQTRSSAMEVVDKHPGYNASDSDSDELRDAVKQSSRSIF